jgi:diguanylate cyclase (GGDEF)-like protein
MGKNILNFMEFLSRQSFRFKIIGGAILALLLGVPDYFFGHQVGFSIFYLVPVALTAWYAGRSAGLLVACLSAATWFTANILSGVSYSNTYIPLWNTLVRLTFFITVVFLLNALKREKSSAREDYLTGLGNRRHFMELAEAEIRRSSRYGHPFTLAYIDVDNFKSINDHLGHAAGDYLLKALAMHIQENIRKTDIAARLGGDEFAVLLPESDPESAAVYFDKLHKIISQIPLRNGRSVTFSIGVVTFIISPTSTDEMIKIVDRIMYEAKNSGKNVVKYAVLE